MGYATLNAAYRTAPSWLFWLRNRINGLRKRKEPFKADQAVLVVTGELVAEPE